MNTEPKTKTPETDAAKALISFVSLLEHNGTVTKEIGARVRDCIARLEVGCDQALFQWRRNIDEHAQINGAIMERLSVVSEERDQLRAEVERLRDALAADDIVPKSVGDKLIDLRAQLAKRDEALKVAGETLDYIRKLPTDQLASAQQCEAVVAAMDALRRIEELTKEQP